MTAPLLASKIVEITVKLSNTSQISSLMHEEANKRQERLTRRRAEKRENWLHVGIQVKVITRRWARASSTSVGGVVAVINDFAADIVVDDSKVRLDQQDLETVIPKVGGTVLIVNGRCGELEQLLRS